MRERRVPPEPACGPTGPLKEQTEETGETERRVEEKNVATRYVM